MGLYVESYLRIGEALGEPPGKGVGKGKKGVGADTLSKQLIKRARRARWKTTDEVRRRYWKQNHCAEIKIRAKSLMTKARERALTKHSGEGESS